MFSLAWFFSPFRRQSSVVRRECECECVFDLDLNRALGTYLLYDHRPPTSIPRKERARTTSRAPRIRLSALATRPLLLLTLILVLVLSPGSWNASVTDRITDLLIPLSVHRHRHCSPVLEREAAPSRAVRVRVNPPTGVFVLDLDLEPRGSLFFFLLVLRFLSPRV